MTIFSESFKQALQNKNWGWFITLSAVATYLSYIQQQFDTIWWKTILIFIGAFLSVAILFYAWFFISNAVKRWKEYRVESMWGETIKDLAQAYSEIHQLERMVPNITEKNIAVSLQEFCNKVKKIFDRKTNSNCCVSIKVPVSNYSPSGEWESIQVKNVARDKKHIKERDTDEYKAANHDIIGNTAYSRIISLVVKESGKPHVYLNNDVDPEKDPNYATTSPAGDERKDVPYKSELVVPILPTKYASLKEVSFGGFLCIDSDKKDSFDAEHYDVPMTQGLADGLYVLMLKMLELQERTRMDEETDN